MKVNALTRDETRYYTIRPEDKPYIQKICGVYAYNPESSTHLCELTPSYDLRYLHTYIVWEGDPSEDKRAELDERYCYEGGDDTYMHCADVRQFAKNHPDLHKECGEFDTIEDACEHLNGNWPF